MTDWKQEAFEWVRRFRLLALPKPERVPVLKWYNDMVSSKVEYPIEVYRAIAEHIMNKYATELYSDTVNRLHSQIKHARNYCRRKAVVFDEKLQHDYTYIVRYRHDLAALIKVQHRLWVFMDRPGWKFQTVNIRLWRSSMKQQTT
jgi:hypothetical protein